MKTQKFFLLFFVTALVLSACGAAAPAVEPAWGGDAAGYAAPSDVIAAEQAAPALGAPADSLRVTGGGAGEFEAVNSAPVAGERLVLKTADLALVVADPLAQMDAIIRMAEGMGGWVVTSNLYEVQTQAGQMVKNATITIRVPSPMFGNALSQLEGSAVEVRHQNISGQDVTQAYTDLQSRLRNLEDAAAQLRLIMAEAKKTDEILTVYYQLVQVTEQIEVLKGQIKYYEEAASFSAISINLIAEATLTPPVTIGGWTPQGEARQAVQALLKALQGLATVAIWLGIYLLPLALALGLPLWLVARWIKRQLAAKPDAATG